MDHQMRRENHFPMKSGLVNMTQPWDKEKNLSLRTESNPSPPKHREGPLPTAWAARTHGEQGHLIGILHTARISTVQVIMNARDSLSLSHALAMLISSINAHFITKVKIHSSLSHNFSWPHMLAYFSSPSLTDLFLRKQWPIVALILLMVENLNK